MHSQGCFGWDLWSFLIQETCLPTFFEGSWHDHSHRTHMGNDKQTFHYQLTFSLIALFIRLRKGIRFEYSFPRWPNSFQHCLVWCFTWNVFHSPRHLNAASCSVGSSVLRGLGSMTLLEKVCSWYFYLFLIFNSLGACHPAPK